MALERESCGTEDVNADAISDVGVRRDSVIYYDWDGCCVYLDMYAAWVREAVDVLIFQGGGYMGLVWVVGGRLGIYEQNYLEINSSFTNSWNPPTAYIYVTK